MIPYHRALTDLTHGYVRQESGFTVSTYMIVLMLSYLCDLSCYKCGLIQSKNKNIEVNICNGKCIKFICGECVMSRDGECVRGRSINPMHVPPIGIIQIFEKLNLSEDEV